VRGSSPSPEDPVSEDVRDRRRRPARSRHLLLALRKGEKIEEPVAEPEGGHRDQGAERERRGERDEERAPRSARLEKGGAPAHVEPIVSSDRIGDAPEALDEARIETFAHRPTPSGSKAARSSACARAREAATVPSLISHMLAISAYGRSAK
jgi:hypothetical protein